MHEVMEQSHRWWPLLGLCPSAMKPATEIQFQVWNAAVQGTHLNYGDMLVLMTGQVPGNLSAIFGDPISPGGWGRLQSEPQNLLSRSCPNSTKRTGCSSGALPGLIALRKAREITGTHAKWIKITLCSPAQGQVLRK